MSPARMLVAAHAFVKLGRPLFLVGGVVLHALGAVVAVVQGSAFDLSRHLRGQLIVSLFQLMTHYANDYFDLAADRANSTPTRWSGGSRVLPSGALSPVVALAAAVVLAAGGVSSTVWFTVTGAFGAASPGAPVAFAAMFVLAWGYSGPPLRLHARGLGPLAVPAVVAGLVPLAGFLLQRAGAVGGLNALLAAIAGPFLLQLAMIVAVDVPDAVGDAAAGKRTVVVRWGRTTASWLYVGATGLAFAALPLARVGGLPAASAWLAAMLFPLAAWQMARVVRGAFDDARTWDSVGFCAVALFVGTAIAELAGMVASIVR